MEKSLLKDSVRQIKNTFKRFLSIVAIVLLGVGFFAGITATSPDMKDTIDTYFDDEDYLLSYGQILRSKIEWNYDYDEERLGYEDVNNKIILMQYTGLKDEN